VRKVTAPPTPTPAQVAAYETLKKQVGVYAEGAREYRDTVTEIIKLHYGMKKREVLEGLDIAVAHEKQTLRAAQLTAIAALEQFIKDYSGAAKDDDATPNAMYRLAALYEDRARGEDAKEDMSIGLRPAIAYYKRVLVEFPDYRERAGVMYFLGHAMNDAGRTDEAQQVWRALVCNNHFTYPTPPDPKDPEHDTVRPLPQDNKEEFWIGFRQRYPSPDYLRRRGRPTETVFVDPYPADCKGVGQPNIGPKDDPKYVQEVWWQIGNWEFDQLDNGAGLIRGRTADPYLLTLPSVWGYNRGASAYQHALEYKNRNLFGVALYKYAWTLFKQQRYEAATREFVKLLTFTDEQEKLTGDSGADFRAEAYQYIAGSLLNVDFKGPDADEPYIPRPDPIEEGDPLAEKKLHVAVDRVQDPSLIPQDKPWAIEIYKSLASEMRGVNHFANAIEVYQAVLKKWPMHASAPEVQASIAETYDQMNLINNRPGTPEWDRVAGQALGARTALANYIGNTPWVDANKDNPQAIQAAERLVKGGLRNAAAAHTNNARQALADAQASGDPAYQIERLTRAQADYRLAAMGWYGFLPQDENAPDAYESRYWLADARFNVVRIGVVLNKLDKNRFPEPSPKEIDEARQAALDVRDSNEDDKYLQNAALMVVGVADVRRDLEYQRYDATGGQSGIEKVTELKVTADEPPKPLKTPLPAAVKESMAARDEYVQRVPASMDTEGNLSLFQYYVGETYFLYGQFDEARGRFEPMYKERCGKDKYGYLAWEKLITMSNKMGDAERSRQLAEAEKAKSCALSEEQKQAGALIVNPTLQEAAYVKAREKFDQAQKASPGPERDKLWREAGAMYEAALSAAPGRDEAPEAAMNAAYAYKQVGDFNKAIDLYNKFIAEYGSEERLTTLQKGDAKEKKAPDLKKYEERVKFLGGAYDALASTYYGFFNYQRAAETFDKIASNERFDEKKRKDSARNAMVLYANMGQRQKMLDQSKIYAKLKPTADEKANADFLIADYDYKQWNPQGADNGGNREVRIAADRAHQQFYAQNKNNAAAGKYALESAWKVAKLKKAGGDPAARGWSKTTITAWEAFDRQNTKTPEGAKESTLPPYSDYGAEAEYSLIDDELREKYDYETNHHRYTGAVDDIVGEYDANGNLKKPGKLQTSKKEATSQAEKLDHTINTYKSPEWTPAALARQGTIADSIRTALYETRPPALKYFTAREEALLKQLENSGRDDLQEKADQYRDAKKDAWRERRDKEIAAMDEGAVGRYVTAVLLARQLNVGNAAVSHAIARLAYLENVAGADKMQTYVSKVIDPTDPERKRTVQYQEGMFMQARAGLTSTPPASGRPTPAPVPPAP